MGRLGLLAALVAPRSARPLGPGAGDRAGARDRHRRLRRARQHGGLADRLQRRQLRGAARPRPRDLADRGHERAGGVAAAARAAGSPPPARSRRRGAAASCRPRSRCRAPGARSAAGAGRSGRLAARPDGPPVDGVYAESRARPARRRRRPPGRRCWSAASPPTTTSPSRGALRLPGGQRLRFVGVGGSPEYFLVTRPGGGDFGGAEAQFAVVFTSLRTAQRDRRRPPRVNDAVMRLATGRRSPRGARVSSSGRSTPPAQRRGDDAGRRARPPGPLQGRRAATSRCSTSSPS